MTTKPASPHRFLALERALELIALLRVPLAEIRTEDADLARQIRRAANSIALNLGEGERRRGKDRRHHYRIAAGSARETQVALRVAVAWREGDGGDCVAAIAKIDEVLAMLWRITEG